MQEKGSKPAKKKKSKKSSKPKPNWKVLASALLLLILLVTAGGVSYWVGLKDSGDTPSESPSPTPSETPTSSPSPVATTEGAASPTPTSTPTPTPTPTPTTVTKTIMSTALLDGFQSSNGGGNAGIEIRAGRNINLVMRGFVSFDISSLPSGAVIEEASLRLYQTKISGDPYLVGFRAKVDHLDYGDTFENSDYSLPSISASFTNLAVSGVSEWKDADVADALRNDLTNGRSRSQYRIHFENEIIGGDAIGDFAYFESADNTEGTGNIPQLFIKYHE